MVYSVEYFFLNHRENVGVITSVRRYREIIHYGFVTECLGRGNFKFLFVKLGTRGIPMNSVFELHFITSPAPILFEDLGGH